MKGITLFYSNRFQSLQLLSNKAVLNSESKLVIENNIDSSDKVGLFLINPFNYIIDYFTLEKSSEKSISIFFNSFMPSGVYYIKLEIYSNILTSNSSLDSTQLIEFFSFQYSGIFSQFNWLVTYAVNTIVKNGMDIRLAAPKQYFPFLLVDSLEGKPVSAITTDVWSNWLVYDTSKKIGTNDMMFGYRGIVYSNYLLFTFLAFDKKYSYDKSEFIKFLIAEPGIESSDLVIKTFGEKISAKSLYGKIHQILYLINNYLTFKDQQGEFGAKYAVLNKQGDCTEYSALFTALCRLSEIPSRLVAGLKKIGSNTKNEWIRHAWSEIYFEGLWIPIDVVEGKSKLIGFHPDLIPLFKGNWMADNMHRELKISILDEFADKLTTTDLLESYSRLTISFKVQPINHNTRSNNLANYNPENSSLDFQVVEVQPKDTDISMNVFFNQLEKGSIIGIYYKTETISTVKSPKLVHYIEQLKEIKTEKIELLIHSPEFPGFYEQGVFICSTYGEIIGLHAIRVEVK